MLRVGIKPASMYEKNRIVEVFFIHDRAEICNMYLYTLILIHAVKIIKIIFTLTIIMTSLFFIIPNVSAESDSVISPRKQLESGIAPNDVICKNHLVLAERNSGNVVCVYESSAKKLGWKIIKSTSIYENKILDKSNSSKNIKSIIGTVSSTEPSIGNLTLSISKLPNIGETAVITITTTATNGISYNGVYPAGSSHLVYIVLSPHFEFVDVDPFFINTNPIYKTNVTADGSDTISFSTTIRAISEGNAQIFGELFGPFNDNTPTSIIMHISENTTISWIPDPLRQITPPTNNGVQKSPPLSPNQIIINDEYQRRQDPKRDTDIKISLSNLPNVGETAIVTLTTNDFFESQLYSMDITPLGLNLGPGLEIVDNGTLRTLTSRSYAEIFNFSGKESISVSLTIRAVSKGITTIYGTGNSLSTSDVVKLNISENTTRIYDDNIHRIDPGSNHTNTQSQSAPSTPTFSVADHGFYP